MGEEMTQKDNGGPAFPRGTYGDQEGMTMRDWFAGQALAGYASSGDLNPYGVKSHKSWSNVASCMYDIADAMLEARNK